MAGAPVQSWEDATAGTATSFTLTVSGATANNTLVGILCVRLNPGTVTTPTGWTLRASQATTNCYLYVYTRLASGNSSDNFAPSWDGASRRYVGAVVEYSGLDTTAPFEAQNTNTGTSGTSLGTNSATATSANGLAVTILAHRDQDDASSESLSSGTVYSTHDSGSNNFPGVVTGYEVYTSSGSKSDTWSWTGTSDEAVAAILVFKEGAAGGDTEVSGNLEQLTLTANSANIAFDVGVNGLAEALSLTTYQASISADTNINGSAEALSLTTYPASLAYDVNVIANVEALTLTQYQASIQTGNNVDVGPEALTLTTLQASIAYDVDVLANAEALSLTTYSASIAYGVNVETSVEALSLTTNQATLTFDVNVSGAAEALTLTTYQAQILTGAGTEISASAEALEITTLAATIKSYSLFAFPEIDGFNARWVIDPLDKLFVTDETGAETQVLAKDGTYHANPVQVDRFGQPPNMYLDPAEDYYMRLANKYGVYKYGFARNSGTWSKVKEVSANARSLTLSTYQATIS